MTFVDMSPPVYWFEVLFIAIAQDVVVSGVIGKTFTDFSFGFSVLLRIESAEIKLCSFGTYSLSIFVDICII